MKYLALLLFFCTITTAYSQSFPDDWLGSYEGEMLIGDVGRPTDTIRVTFDMETLIEDSVWSYKMAFYSDKYGTIVKDYQIAAKSKDDHQNFLFDEKNGIVMEITLMDGTFYGMYEVLNLMYISTIKYHEDGLYYDLFAAQMADPLITQTEVEEEQDKKEQMPPIIAKSYAPGLHQTAFFKRIK